MANDTTYLDFIEPSLPKTCSANDNSAYRCSANDKSALYRYKTASIDYSRICNRKRISEKSRRLEIQYCRRSLRKEPKKSTTRASRELNIPQPTVWRVLKHHLHMKPYKLQLLQAFHPDDHNKRYHSRTLDWKKRKRRSTSSLVASQVSRPHSL
ncbi:hypothetical protein ANN_25319 [Periplaneta americana]|uniref:Uncharacterized protein n=1 Tax=Periplaneta americana TaxID=6978 RepID=A0ABQ8S1C3_PERAM|nr:hypothetical protein ANN_25319 [Periplaneta americana]